MPNNGLASSIEHIGADDSTSSADQRPILPRSPANAWQKCEVVRAQLYAQIEEACRAKQIEALVLQSYPFAQPVWVKFESWAPIEGFALTARQSMTVKIMPMPFHRFETIYSVEWEKHGQSGVFGRLHRFGSAEIAKMLDLLCAQPATQVTRRRVRSILKPGQVRINPLQLWRPRNKIVAVRRDYMKMAAWLATVVGVVMMIADRNVDTLPDVFEAESRMPEVSSPASTPASPPSSVREPEAVPARASGPATAAAPNARTQPAKVVSGVLDAKNKRLPDGRYYDEYTYQKVAGEQVRISMRSTEFDSFLMAGTMSERGFRMLLSNDDEKPDSLNALLVLPATMSGEIVIRATSAAAGERGAYAIEVQQ